MQQEHEEITPNILASLPGVVWQRRWLIVALGLLGLVAGVVAALAIPPMYQSNATVLIESAQLPADLLNSSVNDVIEQRIAKARERVLSRQDLIRLIRANGLYPDEQRRLPMSTVVEKMKGATAIEAVAVDLGGGFQSQPGRGTMALRIGFSYPDPVKAQIVAQQFVNRFLEVDASAQADQAEGARAFLTEQANQLQSQIGDIEDQIRRIKTDNGTTLALQSQSTGNPEADATRIDGEIAGLVAQNAQLASSGGQGDGSVAQAEAALRIARAKYSESHPDVVAAKAQLEAAKHEGGTSASANPIIAANRAQINALRAAKSIMLSQSSTVRAAQAQAPALADRIDQLEKREDVLRENYRVISGKAQAAQMSARMESQQKGERLSLADPPVVPDKPFRPNRPVIVAGAVAAGVAMALGIILLIEFVTRPIRGVDALRAAVGEAPMVVIPDFDQKPSLLLRWLERRGRRKAARA